jgi:23S rRNA pseudouridine1911/1915/1917 synthase
VSEHRLTIQVDESSAGSRLDAFLGRFEELGSRSRVAALIKAGAVTVDGVARSKSYAPTPGQTIVVTVPEEAPPTTAPENLPVAILFEDQWLMVVDKPAGMPVHPSKGHSSGTLVNALVGHGAAGGEEFRPGVVHRLDKDTTGLLVVASRARCTGA